jgi:hypothetical protein
MMPIGQASKFSATTAENFLSKEEPVCDSEGKIHGFQIERHIRCPDGEYFYYLGDTEKYSFRPISQGVAQAILGKRYKPAKPPETPPSGMNEKAADSIH